MRGAPSQREVAQGFSWHMEGAGGVNMRGAPSQPKAAQGIVRHMEGAGGVISMRGASSQH